MTKIVNTIPDKIDNGVSLFDEIYGTGWYIDVRYTDMDMDSNTKCLTAKVHGSTFFEFMMDNKLDWDKDYLLDYGLMPILYPVNPELETEYANKLDYFWRKKLKELKKARWDKE